MPANIRETHIYKLKCYIRAFKRACIYQVGVKQRVDYIMFGFTMQLQTCLPSIKIRHLLVSSSQNVIQTVITISINIRIMVIAIFRIDHLIKVAIMSKLSARQ